jgi:hypothetical protein
MSNNKIIVELEELSNKLPSLIVQHSARIDDISAQMDELHKAGLIYASTHWREGKYFYLVYPVKAGEKRRRDYIGTDKEKIEAAQAAIERGKTFNAFAAQLKQYEALLSESRRVLKYLVDDMTRPLR